MSSLMCPNRSSHSQFPPPPPKAEDQPPAPEGESVYDSILPQSISYRPTNTKVKGKEDNDAKIDPLDPPPAPEGISVMPLIAFLREGSIKEPGWHRNGERRARGIFPVSSLSSQLEPWERQLVSVCVCLYALRLQFSKSLTYCITLSE
jgi:hypothetical protein